MSACSWRISAISFSLHTSWWKWKMGHMPAGRSSYFSNISRWRMVGYKTTFLLFHGKVLYFYPFIAEIFNFLNYFTTPHWKCLPFVQLLQNRGTQALIWVCKELESSVLQKEGAILGTCKKTSGTSSGWRFGAGFSFLWSTLTHLLPLCKDVFEYLDNKTSVLHAWEQSSK